MNSKQTFTDRARIIFKNILDPIGGFLNRLGLTPNSITLLGLAGTTIGAYVIAQGKMTTGAFILLASVLVDAFDGTMARLRGEPSDFGAFVDSVSDRYAELVTFGGLIYFFLTQNDTPGAMVSFLAAAGSVLVSYVKARAEGLGFTAKVGILTRLERYIVLIPLLVFNQPFIAAAVIAVLANITAYQRILHVRAQGRERIEQSKESKA
ncbi:CDP-alcohol phosphatidyltransferase family protein [Chloroflexi bacterium CFX5]|nr:CDP-diacylglycerol--inositol 3-phosphatidyltransferase [Anaerolineales bacterium]MCK6568940.1 CDP-alcohol phosphatidyltransferase family protein [Anaerolineales bacterium]MDL1918564.1 CDP-alcohol phosphatidyltransferase family protein [Chloroflexi bacterium CFX5]NUQ58111.1 CDP-alcohol phosphatidyltransferase family protein [Anaerolineales bacterium]